MKHDFSFESCEPQVEAKLSAGNVGSHAKNLAATARSYGRCADQRMLRPTCSTICTYACRAADGFSLLHATQPSVPTVGFTGRNTTFSCSSLFNCSGTRATPNPAATA